MSVAVESNNDELLSLLWKETSDKIKPCLTQPLNLEGFIIHSLRLNYTNDMEKAMLGAHGICYKVYCRNHDVRMKVEKRRDQEYKFCQRMIADINRKVHS